ncbi:MAG: hypothetical protein WB586_23250 [Chthoniobacterales bacterium]
MLRVERDSFKARIHSRPTVRGQDHDSSTSTRRHADTIFKGIRRLVHGATLGFVIFALTSCQRNHATTDEELMHDLVGTWITDETGTGYRLYAENSFHRDGFHSADQILHREGETTTWNYTGTWDVRNGKLLASGEVVRSDSAIVEPYQVEEVIERLTYDELVLIDANGGRLVRHRRR